ncbi:1,4-dihydroxy-2-naphthoate octaprenyltransferase [Nonlabens arenilitoris]|uniref:1,4-dihydroxy-2-naphthoate octaprenyltransferase n=1 Tax=Nonlabens arenilitoris TaxID=1217969 RepID=A0A2S7UDJ6_9FLAO|nr:1,4-dihydroxy-2-naphthoate octaprenyltransferase [Nonlabens arenilitoris]PQJ32671.1 1,4-dihydroxy-2-naphthoate octaprenyltransferase [Nonlabens arenilitoris]
MSTKFKAWISAARLRTLPLSISGILVGSAYAYLRVSHLEYLKTSNVLGVFSFAIEDFVSDFNFLIPILALITTLGFQVLSNFANDYGDGVKGTDNDDRVGPMRALQSGIILAHEMKRAMIITAVLTLISAIALIYVSLGIEQLLISLFFLVLGIAAIWAAIKYTVGDNAYGYRGLGDVFVFIFFGPVSVMGIFYLITKAVDWNMILPSITIGLLSVAVLNLNNMRDIESDKKAGKNTIVVKMGLMKAKLFHYSLITIALVTASLFFITLYYKEVMDENMTQPSLFMFLPLLAFLPLFLHLKVVELNKEPALLDPELKKVALSTFAFAVLSVLSVWIVS